MKGLTFGVAFVLTVCIVIGGTLVYPNIVGQAVTFNNNYVFGFFLATLLTLLVLGWIGEKIIYKISKPKRKN
jgi:predicted neutral ceramidase superfamily lipid hydrolase